MSLHFQESSAPQVVGRDDGSSAVGCTTHADIVVLGAGIAGTCAANALATAGYSVVLIDSTAKVPPTLRAEKLGSEAADLFERLGLSSSFRAVATPIYSIWVAQFGRVMTRQLKREYGFSYGEMVSRFREDRPPQVELRIGRVVGTHASADRQRVTFADGSTVEGRLLIVATGLGDSIKRKLGFETRSARDGHSMCIAFDLDRPRYAFPFESLVYYGERRADRVSYFSLFPIGTRMRANLFVYRRHDDPWTKAFRADPAATLCKTLPRLESVCGPISVSGSVDLRPIDLVRTEDTRRDGVVLIGDALFNTCPITGTGIRKALVDIERLTSTYVPSWFATPGMGAEKIAEFYDDPVKSSFDAASIRDSDRLRGIKLGRDRRWLLSRVRSAVKWRVSFALHRASNAAASLVATLISLL